MKYLILTFVFSFSTFASDVFRCQKELRLTREARIEDMMFPYDFHFARGEQTYNEYISLSHAEESNKVVLSLSEAPLVCFMDIEDKDSSLSRCGLKSDIGELSQSTIKQYFQNEKNGFDASEVSLGLDHEFFPSRIYIYYDSVKKRSLAFREYRFLSLSQNYNCEPNMAVDESQDTPDKPNNSISVPQDSGSVLEAGTIQLN